MKVSDNQVKAFFPRLKSTEAVDFKDVPHHVHVAVKNSKNVRLDAGGTLTGSVPNRSARSLSVALRVRQRAADDLP